MHHFGRTSIASSNQSHGTVPQAQHVNSQFMLRRSNEMQTLNQRPLVRHGLGAAYANSELRKQQLLTLTHPNLRVILF